MTAPRAFTQAEVKRAAEAIRTGPSGIVVGCSDDYLGQMLDAFAARLQIDEDYASDIESGQVHMIPARLAGRLDSETGFKTCEELEASAKEEGRREVLREVMSIDPFSRKGDGGSCNFCGEYCPDGAYRRGQLLPADEHLPSCLWLRAQEAIR